LPLTGVLMLIRTLQVLYEDYFGTENTD